MQARCAGCHTIRGTEAAGQIAPDLTHIASAQHSRRRNACPTRPTISPHGSSDPQRVKPGNQMPPNPLAADDLQALVAYLETLR